ncbi:MAG: energy-coupling factor ABC transporter ATP-binding protein [Thermoprotei archaeon]
MAVKLQLRDVWFRYSREEDYILRGAELSLRESELVVITGPNGSGKTTLILLAAGLLRPEKGEVLLEGKPLHDQLPLARKKIGVTFQDPDDQFFNATVYDEIAFALRQLELGEDEVKTHVTVITRRLGIEHLLSKPPYRLSGGEKVKVALASILVYEPEVLLLDEPTAYLTPESKNEIMKMLRELKERGKSILIATNDPDVTKYPLDKVLKIVDGRLITESPTT